MLNFKDCTLVKLNKTFGLRQIEENQTFVGLVASGHSPEKILQLYPYLEAEDIQAALEYAAWRVEEMEVALVSA